MDEEQVCPRCKTSKYRNPSMKLMVNVCGHPLCENCVNLLFAKGSGTCPQCDVPLRRSGFRVQLFEDSGVEKDLDIRRRILREFNKQEHDFDTLRQYNDYLEDVETIIFNLANEVDVLNTNKKIEAYKRDNKEAIVKNRARGRREDEELEEILLVESQVDHGRQQQEMTRVEQQRRSRVQRREALIDELSSSYGNATDIVAEHARTAVVTDKQPPPPPPGPLKSAPEPATLFSSGVRIGAAAGSLQGAAPPPPLPQGTPYVYEAPQLPMDGPAAPDDDQLQPRGYLTHIRQASDTDRAGGYDTVVGCLRALQEGLAGLLFFPGAAAAGGEAVSSPGGDAS